MTPILLERFLKRLPDFAVSEKERSEWGSHACSVLLQREFLVQLQSVWDGILAAKSWDEFVEQRGQYKALAFMADLTDLVDIGPAPSTPEEVNELREKLEEMFSHETG